MTNADLSVLLPSRIRGSCNYAIKQLGGPDRGPALCGETDVFRGSWGWGELGWGDFGSEPRICIMESAALPMAALLITFSGSV